MNEQKEDSFAVFAETNGETKPLILTGLTFARLMDDVVVPYQTDQAFFIDGAPLKKQNLKKLKIIKQKDFFAGEFQEFHWALRRGSMDKQELYAEQYHIRLEALLRENGEDVTSQVIKAFDNSIRPSLKDYIPKREELIKAALTIFVESMKTLNR